MRMLRTCLLLTGIAAFALADPALAKNPDPCGEKGDATACYAAHQQEVLELYQLASAENELRAGSEVRRAIFVNGYSQPIIAVQFVRAAGREPSVEIYRPAETDLTLLRPALTAAVPAKDWATVSDRSEHFDRRLAPLPASSSDEAIVICVHGWTYIVEVTDPSAEEARKRLRRRVENACDRGLAQSYANLLADTALQLLAPCRSIDRNPWDHSAEVLAACAKLSGDRLAAAEVLNRLGGLRWSEDEVARIRPFAGPLDWNGERITNRVTDAWLAKTSELKASLFTRRLHGEGARRVRVDAVLERWTEKGDNRQLWVAPVSMMWNLDRSRGWLIHEAKVGAFVRRISNCDPNRLTGAGNC